MGEKLRVGLIGCGGISHAHLKSLQLLKAKGLDYFTLAAVCDVEEQRARQRAARAQEFGEHPAIFTDVAKLLAAKVVDAVIVCTPHDTHHQIALMALEEGVHVACESAFTITVRAAKRMVETAQRVGKVCAIVSQCRFSL